MSLVSKPVPKIAAAGIGGAFATLIVFVAGQLGLGGAGSTHLRIPDLRGRVSVAPDTSLVMGAASRLTTNNTRGAVGGLETLLSHAHSVGTSGNQDHTHAITVNSTGTGTSHGNLQPYVVANKIIRIA